MEIKYIDLISNSSVPFFTRQNLEIILGKNRRPLDYRIKSLITKGILSRIKSGVYINGTLFKTTASPEELMRYIGCQLVPNSYLSSEYALAYYGILAESIYAMTFITTGKTRKFSTNTVRLVYRNIQSKLYSGYITKQYQEYAYQIATPAKALFDFLYLTTFQTPSAMRELLTDSRINWDAFTSDDKKEFKNSILVSKSRKMDSILQFLISKNII